MSKDFIRKYVIENCSIELIDDTIILYYRNVVNDPTYIKSIDDLKIKILCYLDQKVYGYSPPETISLFLCKLRVIFDVLDDELLDEMINYYVNDRTDIISLHIKKLLEENKNE